MELVEDGFLSTRSALFCKLLDGVVCSLFLRGGGLLLTLGIIVIEVCGRGSWRLIIAPLWGNGGVV